MARCKHSWDLLDKTVLPSGYEQMQASTERLRGGSLKTLFQKKLVYIFKCAHCGDIHKEVESCPS